MLYEVITMEALIDEAYILNNPQVDRTLFEGLHVIPESERYKELAVTDVLTLLKVHEKKKITLIASSDAQIKGAGVRNNFV